MKVSGILLFILILGGLCAPRCGAAVYHSNGSAASVQSIHNSQVQNGDTITLPAGTFTWSTRLNITKAITLQGAGIGVTIIKDAVQSGSTFDLTLVAGKPTRVTGIEFQDGGRVTTRNAPGGIFHVSGVANTNGSQFRMDHCKWNDLNGFIVFDTVLGVIDHTSFISGGHSLNCIYIYGSNWNGQGPFGDGSWAAPVNFGSSDFLFFEDCDFHNNNTTYVSYATDAFNGARYVARHNTLFNASFSDHGTESGGRERGSRAMEIYNNTWTGTNIGGTVTGSRSSRVIFHDNSVSGFINGGKVSLGNWRNFFPFTPWGGADGTNVWDVNEPNAFFTGTAASNSSGTRVTVSGNPHWTPNQWAGYTIRRTSNICGVNTVTFAWIISNTSNIISYTNQGGYSGPGNLSFCAGDTLEFRKVDHALDQPGRGGGSLITGVAPRRPFGWNDQVTEPCYAWNNGAVVFGAGPGVRANVHYFNNVRMPGYTPYTYPHPLVTGAARDAVADFNGDSKPDYVLYAAQTGQTAVWYMDDNIHINSAFGPTPWAGWNVAGVADFNGDGKPDYLLYAPSTGQTAIWYLNNNVRISSAFGPTTWAGWNVAGVADFNGDGKPDYLLYAPSTGQTVIWYLNNNVLIGHASGPTPWSGWSLAGVADFNNDGHPDYLLFNPGTGQTAIWYLNNNVRISSAFGPTIWAGWNVAGVADFNNDGHPDYLLFNPGTGQTAIWYLNNNVRISSAFGPTTSAGWSLVAP